MGMGREFHPAAMERDKHLIEVLSDTDLVHFLCDTSISRGFRRKIPATIHCPQEIWTPQLLHGSLLKTREGKPEVGKPEMRTFRSSEDLLRLPESLKTALSDYWRNQKGFEVLKDLEKI